MRCRNRITLLKLAAVFSVAALAAIAQVHKTDAAQEQPGRLFELIGMSAPLEERIGVDDGAAFAIHFSGDTHGNLDTCG
jgi:hypothetical protein